ncbi:hypothetical protein CPB83DRAFT_898604 [Crepidotus variabilis]|uniref:Uncharacterized protein n=1 Tax=Crepidotus variabilis TaxID=179855 RepID=A0A9P6E796_9AGAR|nr:hypothetical protein CPB83DRAFT_898604 [Crepidotus variabilis]
MHPTPQGSVLSGYSSPGNGASFSLLALKVPDLPLALNTSLKIAINAETIFSRRQNMTRPALGAGIGGLIFLALAIFALLWYRHRRTLSQTSTVSPYDLKIPATGPL